MASTGVNVLRWSALGAGIAYGFMHQRTLTQRDAEQQKQREWAHQESLIAQAKAEFAKQHPQASKKESSAPGLNALIGITEAK